MSETRKTTHRAFGHFKESSEEVNIPCILPDTTLSINGDCSDIFHYGWNESEEIGRWTNKRRAGIQFYVGLDSAKSCNIILNLIFLEQIQYPQSLQIWREQDCIINQSIDVGGLHKMCFSLTTGTEDKRALINLRFFYSYLREPYSIIAAPNDHRSLGFNLHSISFKTNDKA